MKNLNTLIADCKDILDDLNIIYGPIDSVKVNNRLTACWGRCTYNKRTGLYNIELSNRIMQDDMEYEATMNTIIHELLHAGPNRMCHTGEWKRLANLVNREYPQFNITHYTSAEEKGVAERVKTYRYKVVCPICNRSWKYQKAGRVVRAMRRNPNSCTCVCGNTKLILNEV